MHPFLYVFWILATFLGGASQASVALSPALVTGGQTSAALLPAEIVLGVGTERRVDEVCEEVIEGWHRITTCTWQAVARNTNEGVKELPGGQSTNRQLLDHVQMLFVSIILMLVSFGLTLGARKIGIRLRGSAEAFITVALPFSAAVATAAFIGFGSAFFAAAPAFAAAWISAVATTAVVFAVVLMLAFGKVFTRFVFASKWRQVFWLQGVHIALCSIGLVVMYYY